MKIILKHRRVDQTLAYDLPRDWMNNPVDNKSLLEVIERHKR
jgi:hypothetical protein